MDIYRSRAKQGWFCHIAPSRKWLWITGGVAVLFATVALWWFVTPPFKDGEEANAAWYTWPPRKLKTLAVSAIGARLSAYIREQVESATFKTTLTPEQMQTRMLDADANALDRQHDAYRLAKIGSSENMDAVQRYVSSANDEDKASTAELLGAGRNPESKPILLGLLTDPNDDVVCSAIRGLSLLGGNDVAGRLAWYLNSEATPLTIRNEAARSLGNVGTPEAFAVLTQSFSATENLDTKTAILTGLSKFPFGAESEKLYSVLVNADELPVDFRVEAVETLADCPQGAGPFLMATASSATAWEVRAGAVWALGRHDAIPNGPATLLNLAAREPDDVVRRRIYEAVQAHSDVPGEQLFELVLAEKNPAARVAGFNAAALVSKNKPELLARFDNAAVEEMVQVALSNNPLNLRMRAVFALRRAGTPAAKEALARIQFVSNDEVSVTASH